MSDDATLIELTSPVAGSVLTLVANLRQCFSAESSDDQNTQFTQVQDNSATLGQSIAWGEGSSSGSRTLHATSLQLVLKGLIDYMMRSSE